MRVELLNPFIEATKKTFLVMARCTLRVHSAQATRFLPSEPDSVNAVITLTGGAVGALLMRFPSAMVIPTARMFDSSVTALQEGFDAIGEIANIVTGDAKRQVSDQLISISVPQIVINAEGIERVSNLAPWLTVPFDTPHGQFKMSASIRLIKSQPDSAPDTPEHHTGAV